jgi:glycosyltransferase involved in cell wall biosynthesis
VVGEGPALAGLRQRYPKVSYLGVLTQNDLAEVYASAHVFVFPSKTDTFGLVLLEALACGLPVAAYPVTGPLDVIGNSKAGALHEDLRTACLRALEISREDALNHAKRFSWRAASEQFLSYLHPRGVREVQQVEVPV